MSSITLFFLFIPLLALILLAINLIFAPHNPYTEKNSAFECGFHSFLGQNRTQFSISFFIFALLFLLFDLEILLVYPYIVSAYNNSIYGLVNMLIFFLVLTSGFAFELGKKALSIDSRQISGVANKETSIVSKIKDSKAENFNKVSYINNSIRHMSSMKKKTIFQRLLIGGKLGWKTPTLPENVIRFQMNPLIRILRVLGGISTIFLLSNKASLHYMLIFYLAFFFCFFIFYLSNNNFSY